MYNYLEKLESEAIHVIREVYSQFDNPVILFSGGKDSLVLCYLAIKAFYPQKLPFKVMHIDTGHNFKETLEFRDYFVKKYDLDLIIKYVQDSINSGRVNEEKGPNASRNGLQTTTLLDGLKYEGFDVALGGARRDEEKARAKERFFSFRDKQGFWDPKKQRPELFDLYNGEKNNGENFRVFPISNWTELDIWNYIKQEKLDIPSLYFSDKRECVIRKGIIYGKSKFLNLTIDEKIEFKNIRFRTVGDITCTGAIESEANTIDKIIDEIKCSNISERGTRADDMASKCAMEDRKKKGYF